MSPNRSLDFSDKFVLSSGTVSIDLSLKLILLLYYRPKKKFLLPKGRKNAGETLREAAVRETKEESGFECQLVKHLLPTNLPDHDSSPHSEPFAIQQRMVNDVRKLIFWYVAEADSKGHVHQKCEEDEKFETHWIHFEDVADKISYPDDREIVLKALQTLETIP